MQARLGTIDRRYKELQELAKLRKTRLMDALSLYKLFNEADMVEIWIDEKVSEIGRNCVRDGLQKLTTGLGCKLRGCEQYVCHGLTIQFVCHN